MVGLDKLVIRLLPWKTLLTSVEISGCCVSAGVIERSVGTGVLGLIVKDDLDCSSETNTDGLGLGMGKVAISVVEKPNAVEVVGVDTTVASTVYLDDLDVIELAESAPVIKDDN